MSNRVKTAQVTFRLLEEEAHGFKVKCAVQKTTIQAVLEKAVKDFLEEKEKPE